MERLNIINLEPDGDEFILLAHRLLQMCHLVPSVALICGTQPKTSSVALVVECILSYIVELFLVVQMVLFNLHLLPNDWVMVLVSQVNLVVV